MPDLEPAVNRQVEPCREHDTAEVGGLAAAGCTSAWLTLRGAITIDDARAYLARAVQGALLPSHGHRHDEECLMLEGDLFLRDILVREDGFQLAPAGWVHGTVQVGSNCVVCIRGDTGLAVDLSDPDA